MTLLLIVKGNADKQRKPHTPKGWSPALPLTLLMGFEPGFALVRYSWYFMLWNTGKLLQDCIHGLKSNEYFLRLKESNEETDCMKVRLWFLYVCKWRAVVRLYIFIKLNSCNLLFLYTQLFRIMLDYTVYIKLCLNKLPFMYN